ncbi:hypothetical protein BDZ97DRAFT_2080546 [Flammula alnicola]|nr:hypothetical protein BDZ97DRAFT_2080546 [Flammula alnicola]
MDHSTSRASSTAIATRRAIRAANAAQRAQEADELKVEGNELFKKGDYVEAADFYARAVNFDGPKPVLMSNLAAVYLKLELFADAEWAATTALEYDPRMVKARYRRAMARKALFCFKAAISDLESILAQDPGNKGAEEGLQVVRTLMESEGSLEDEGLDDKDPRYDDEPWDLFSDSDTEDSMHLGNGTPCHSYNHDGCAQGAQCNFSHAPDTKSVRDELGKNVCVHFLFGDCRDAECLYSHVRAYLPPRGWWNDPTQVRVAKELFPLVEDYLPDYNVLHDALLKHPQGRAFASRQEREAVFEYLIDVDIDELRPTIMPPISSDPFVLVMSFDYDDTFSRFHQHLLSALDRRVKIVQVHIIQQTLQPALQYLESPSLVGVLITDPGITKRKYTRVLHKLVAYVKNGGSAAIGGQFSGHIDPKSFNDFIKKWGLDWKWGSYFRTTFYINPSNELVQRNPSLAKSYSMKSVHISNIQPEMAIYAQTADSRLESMVFDPVRVKDIEEGESPAVCARVGRGLLSFLGDVNAEVASTNTILAMLGVLDQPSGPLGLSPQASTSSLTTQNAATGSSKNIERTEELGISTFAASEKVTDKFVMILELEDGSMFRRIYADQLSKLNGKIEVKTAATAAQAIELLASPNIHGVYVVDEGISNPSNANVLANVADYVKAGGLVAFGGMFPADIDKEDVPRVFTAFGLPWTGGSYCKSEAQLNLHHETAAKNPTLSDAFYLNAVHLRGFHAEDLFYEQYFDENETDPNFEPPGGDAWEAPILRTHVGKGRLGYIGDVSAQPESTSILLAMLDLMTPAKSLVCDAKKFLIILTSYGEADLQQFIPSFMKDAREKVEVLLGIGGLSNARVIDLLPSKDLIGVVIGDTSVLFPQNAYLLSKLVEYSKNGGTLVFGWLFCKLVTLTQFRPLFRDNWGLDWDMVGVHPQEVKVERNPENTLFKGKEDLKLPNAFRLSGIHIKGLTQSMAVYRAQNRPNFWQPQDNIFVSSVIFAEVEKGHIGYIGSSSLDDESRSIFYAMVGLL